MSQSSCRIYLITPPAFEPAAFAPLFGQALMAGDVACVLLWLRDNDDAAWQAAGKALLPAAHAKRVPLIAQGGPLPRFGDADGIHVEGGIKAITAAHAVNSPRRMVGAGGLATRHDAMAAAEAGVDYVMFASADPAGSAAMTFEALLDITAWWAEIFQVPCVAPAASHEQAVALAGAGADFVAVGDFVWSHEEGPGAAIGALVQAFAGIKAVEP